MTWADLKPEPGIVEALDHAGARPEAGSQNEKRNWSEKFADACAVTIARHFRAHSELSDKAVRPVALSDGTEPLTPLGAGVSKRIDVTVADAVLGLEIGVSLKGLNFVDGSSGNYDKNLTGRMYELGDEVRVVHEHLPHAFMVGIFFLPLASCADKTERAPSSFANAVIKLRSRTSRLDAALAAHASRCDAAYVALYTVGVEAGFERGLVRFFDVRSNPPKRGRPRMESTLSLGDVVDAVVAAATNRASVDWADAEDDPTSMIVVAPDPNGAANPEAEPAPDSDSVLRYGPLS
ncbi:MAG TPA: hypothetical protein VHA82_08620 [Ramlibacter sp.]|uniref:hypothetical protein n=1 Tax=Ramlibacter sp. TaxID=1917967 RepID=UPI002CB5EDBE|nr:hypothetical protein [Ramlibacter sp.]HVZ43860.1 hypothetical protein [Ramlibacter sp.]